MIKILFICHGNICRSPMAEFIMKDLAAKSGRGGEFHIESAAVSREEIGNPVYPPARRELQRHGISCAGKTARQVTMEDMDRFDLIYYMDSGNGRRVNAMFGEKAGKCRPLLERDVADPWYTGDFQMTWEDISLGCRRILEEV